MGSAVRSVYSSADGGDTKQKEKFLALPQMRELQKFAARLNRLGINFAVCDVDGQLVIPADGGKFNNSARQSLEKAVLRLLRDNAEISSQPAQARIWQLGRYNQILAAVLRSADVPVGVALIDLTASSDFMPHVNGKDASDMSDSIFSEMLALLSENFNQRSRGDRQIELVSTELAQVYEELVLLYKLSTNMNVTESYPNFLQMACDSLTEIVAVEGIAVLLDKTVEDEKKLVLTAGSGVIDIDERMAAIIHNRLAEQISIGKEALVDSDVDSPFKYDWPANLKNIIAVPLCGKDKIENHFDHESLQQYADTPQEVSAQNRIIGLMVAVNRVEKPDFDSADVKLFNSVANVCAVFVENGRLFKDLRELFIGSLRALINSIDAKDQYTRGHSERVAFISRWIAERLAEKQLLDRAHIHRVYLAGLLHDIGKMGIHEAVLRKPGKLTDEEFNIIKTHPAVGAGILSEIKQMRDIVPGVLSHHERMDGAGYPNALTAEKIPVVAKIIGLADSFDAMTSKRTYREALTVDQALAEIQRNIGTQFDEIVATAFLDSDVYNLWSVLQNGFTEIYKNGNLADYGAVAVGTLIR